MRERIVGALIFLIYLCASDAAAQSAPVGFITPLTGARSSIGEDARRAAELAVEELRRAPEWREGQIELMFQDSQGDPQIGVTAYKQLVARGVRFIITQNSNVSLPIAELVNHDKVLQLAISTTSDKYSRPDDLTFRMNGPTSGEAAMMASFIDGRLKAEAGGAALVTMQDEYPMQLRANLLRELQALGLALAAQEEFLPGETDFRSMIARLKKSGARHIMFLGYQTQAGRFVRQARELQLHPATLVACTPVDNSEFFETAGPAAEGVYVTGIAIDRSAPANAAFRKRYGRDMNVFSANAYDAVVTAYRALQQCRFQADAECLKKALCELPPFHGVSGDKQFDKVNGDMQDTYEIRVAHGGQFVPQ